MTADQTAANAKPALWTPRLDIQKRADEVADAIEGAVLRHHWHEVRRFVRQAAEPGSDPRAILRRTNIMGKTLLEEAVELRQAGIVDLVAPNSDLETVGLNGVTPLCRAVEENQIEIVRILLAHGANINASRRSTGFTPLIRAIQLKLPEMALLLIAQGAGCDSSIQIWGNRTTADCALEYDLPAAFFALRDKGVVSDAFPPLMMAVAADAVDTMRACLARDDLAGPARAERTSFAMLVASCRSDEARHLLLSWRTARDVDRAFDVSRGRLAGAVSDRARRAANEPL